MTESADTGGRGGYRLADHPWAALPIFMVAFVVLLGLVGTVFTAVGLQPGGPLQQATTQVLLLFVLTPFVLGLPKGRKGMATYLDDIRLSQVKPLVPLVVLGISCWVILALCQGLGTIIYRLTEGKELSAAFLLSVWDLRVSLPPRSAELLVSLPSALEEVAFRGVVVTLFLSRYRRNASIAIPAAAFGALHLLNLAGGGQAPVWVLGQVGWAFLMGLMYGYLFIKADSLLPGMILHWLGNAFVAAIMAYLNTNATTEVQVLYGVVTTFGLVPVVLIIAWVRYFSRRWLRPL
ncbi:MAG: CPBP family intramembrane metalloprotease [Fidelibacterota bacterium]|nr:MAG: CPBP family intramembrane metalloprotease [Candidatus Neomarinimicrobiota bacterium]